MCRVLCLAQAFGRDVKWRLGRVQVVRVRWIPLAGWARAARRADSRAGVLYIACAVCTYHCVYHCVHALTCTCVFMRTRVPACVQACVLMNICEHADMSNNIAIEMHAPLHMHMREQTNSTQRAVSTLARKWWVPLSAPCTFACWSPFLLLPCKLVLHPQFAISMLLC